MANPEHVAIVMQGTEVLNKWREHNPDVNLDLRLANFFNATLKDANLSGTDLRDADLRFADLSNVNLRDANFKYANLSNANLSNASLRDADLRDADLSSTNLDSANLSNTKLRSANLAFASLINAYLRDADLRNAYINSANLTFANLSDTDLSSANLAFANLSGTDLSATQALGTNFQQATLTGACIEDWNINSNTKLEGAICEYIFLKQESSKYWDRRPSSGKFAQGDFAKLVQKSISTVDLIFRNGINWEAFAHSFQKLQIQTSSDELDIQAIENKGDGNFVIRVNTPPGLDKAKIQEFVMEEYGKELKAIEAKYHDQLQAKDEQIKQYRRENTNLWEMAKIMANRPINVESRTMIENNSNTTNINATNIAALNSGSGSANASNINQVTTTSEKQDLAEAAAEIQRLLQQLEANNPNASEADKQTFISMGIGLTKKQRLINAIKSGGKTAIEELVDNPYLNVAIAIIEGWKEAESE